MIMELGSKSKYELEIDRGKQVKLIDIHFSSSHAKKYKTDAVWCHSRNDQLIFDIKKK